MSIGKQEGGQRGLRGVYTIMPTPFTEDGRVDEESLASLTEFLIDRGVDGLTVLGVLGEAHKLSEREQEAVVVQVVKAAAGRVPIYAGASAGGVTLGVERGLRFLELGAAGLMVAPAAPDPRAISAQYRALDAAITDTGVFRPIIIHDYPAVTGIKLSAELISRLATDCATVTTIKLEDPPTGPKVSALREIGADLTVLGGLGGLYLVEELARGADGIMTGLSFPELLVMVVRAFESGEQQTIAEASASYFAAMALLRYEFQPAIGLAIRKEVYRRRGAIQTALVRAPGSQVDERLRAELDQVLNHVGLPLRPV